MQPEAPQEQHRWLERLLGDWTYSSPNEPDYGTETVKPLGGLWVVGEGTGKMPDGTPALMRITLGYDPAKGHFVGTWIGSMMNHVWIYKGTLDDTGQILTLESEGPDFKNPGATASYRDIIEFLSDDARLLRSEAQGPDGEWKEFMRLEYRRKM
jgi:hypothetical protein